MANTFKSYLPSVPRQLRSIEHNGIRVMAIGYSPSSIVFAMLKRF